MKTVLLIFFLFGALHASGAERVVSLSPSLTEAVCLIGGETLLVGRSSSCNRPASILRLPSVGKFLSPSPEKIAALEPTLVLSTPQPGRGTAQLLAALGIRFVELPDRTLEDYPALLRKLGRLLNLPAGEREALLAERRLAELRRAAAAVPEARRRNVLFLVGLDPAGAAGRRSFIHRMVELAGGRSCRQDRPRLLLRFPGVAGRTAAGSDSDSGTAGAIAGMAAPPSGTHHFRSGFGLSARTASLRRN